MSILPSNPDFAVERGVPRAAAVIDIGATSIRMAIAEIYSDGQVRTLDTLTQPMDLGREAFENRRFSQMKNGG